MELRESHVQEFHAIAIRDIYPCGTQYRDARFTVAIQGSKHKLPEAARVPFLVRDLTDELNTGRTNGVAAIDRAVAD